jgi:hypothetical protein
MGYGISTLVGFLISLSPLMTPIYLLYISNNLFTTKLRPGQGGTPGGRLANEMIRSTCRGCSCRIDWCALAGIKGGTRWVPQQCQVDPKRTRIYWLLSETLTLRNDRIQREGGAWREGREGIIEVRGSRPRKGGPHPLQRRQVGGHQGTHGLLEVVPTVYRIEEREKRKVTSVARYWCECEPVSLVLITVFRDAA